MSDSNGRIERWYLVDKFGPSTYGYATLAEAISESVPGQRIANVRELRDGEEIIETKELTALRNALDVYKTAADLDAKTIAWLRAAVAAEVASNEMRHKDQLAKSNEIVRLTGERDRLRAEIETLKSNTPEIPDGSRGFRVGDRVRHKNNLQWTGSVIDPERSIAGIELVEVEWSNKDAPDFASRRNLELLTPSNSAPWSVVEEARRERDESIERAEKAIASRNASWERGEALAKRLDEVIVEAREATSRALAAESALNDERESRLMESVSVDGGERERFRFKVMRDSYQRALTQMHWSANDLKESGLTYAQWCARQARDEAAVLTDAAFGFLPAKEA